MKVVMVGPFGLRPHGTMSQRALPLAKALACRGHEVEVVLPPWSCPEDSGLAWREDGVSVHNIVLPPPISVLSDAAIVWRLLRRALASHPQVLHFFKPKAHAGLSAMLVWWLAGLRLTKVRVVLDTDDWEGEGGWNDVRPYSWLERRFFAWQERWGMTHCDGLTVASRELERRALEMGIDKERIRYVPNGSTFDQVVLDAAAGVRVRAEWGLGDDPVVLLYTRFFEFEPSRVIRVWNRVTLEAPSTRFLVSVAASPGRRSTSSHSLERPDLVRVWPTQAGKVRRNSQDSWSRLTWPCVPWRTRYGTGPAAR